LAIAVAQLRLRSVEEARRTFERAIQIAKQISEYEERNKAIVGIIQIQAEEYLLEDGLQNLEMIDWAPCRDMALVSIAKAQAQMELFADAHEMVQKVEEWLSAKIEILTTVAVVKARTGRSVEAQTDFQNAFRVVQMMQSSASSRWEISEIAQAQAQAGFYDDSLITANMIDDYMSEALCTIAVAQAEMQLIQDALQTAQKIEHTYDRDFALFAISKEYVKEKKLGEAFEVAQRIEDFEYRTVALCTVAEAYFGEGNLGRAKEIYEDAHLAAVRMENGLTRSIALHNISISQTRVGLIEDADRTKQSIPDDFVSKWNILILPYGYPYAGAHDRRFVYSLRAALRACAALRRGYPSYAREIGEVYFSLHNCTVEQDSAR
jgi:tetratricopeptide (TPR) repeat protein